MSSDTTTSVTTNSVTTNSVTSSDTTISTECRVNVKVASILVFSVQWG